MPHGLSSAWLSVAAEVTPSPPREWPIMPTLVRSKRPTRSAGLTRSSGLATVPGPAGAAWFASASVSVTSWFFCAS